MLGKAWRFVKRNRGKIVVASVIAGGTYMAINYLREKFREYQDMEAVAMCDKARRYHHFDSVQRSCNITVLAMLPNLEAAIHGCFDVEKLLQDLQTGTEDKVKTWQLLKVSSVARTLSTMYACSLLVVLLRVQFNIVAGYIYPQTISFDVSENGEITTDSAIGYVQQRYLNIIRHFISDGIPQLCKYTYNSVLSVMETNSLKKRFTISSLQGELDCVIKHLETCINNGDMNTAPIIQFMLPDTSSTQRSLGTSPDDIFYDKLLKATNDTIKSEYFHDILRQCVCRAHGHLMQFITETYASLQHKNGHTELSTVEIPMAKLIPVITGLHRRMCMKENNAFIPQLLIMPSVKDFACRVYEAASYRESKVK